MSVLAARNALLASLMTLAERRDTTTDATEKKKVLIAIDEVGSALDQLALDNLLKSAGVVSEAAKALEGAVEAAKRGPFDRHLEKLQNHIAALDEARSGMHAVDALPPAPEQGAAPLPPAQAGTFRAAAPSAPSTATDFPSLRTEYQQFFDACTIPEERRKNMAYYIDRLERHRDIYKAVSSDTGAPWLFIGILHAMESGFSFQRHLHNGDPLSARTVRVPAGHPRVGDPPFTWRASAVDALQLKHLHEESDWSVPRQIFHFEKFNGFGYRRRGIPSPYLWSFSNLYKKGKFVADGVFDPEKISGQSGSAVILKAAIAKGLK